METQDPRWLPPLPATDPAQYGPLGPAQPVRESWFKRALAPLIAVGALIAKFAKFALIIAKGGKIFATAGTMVVSVLVYTVIWGFKFAVGFVGLLFLHEMGHYVQLRREGVRPGGMFFIPMLGAAITTRSLGGSALAEARVGLAGPIAGTLATLAILPIIAATNDDFWRALAFTGFFLNLFNLIPLAPLDGGRAMAAMAPWMWWVGFAGMVAFFIFFPNPILILFILLGGMESWRRWKARRSGEEGNAAYYRVSPRARLVVALVYIGLIAVLALGMDATHVQRGFGDVHGFGTG